MPADALSLSACLIVRNEEDFLEGCLRSIRSVVDEIVIGDTGSVDRTADIARDFGAKLYNIPWTDNFSAARNRVIEHARGEWILSIDADERLRPISKSEIQLCLEDITYIASYLMMHPKTGWTGHWVVRLFRNDPRIRFNGFFHESLRDGIERLLTTNNKKLGYSRLVLDHLGYDDGQREKHIRNFPLLLKEIERDPSNGYIWGHLGAVHADLGEDALAERAWKKAIDIEQKRKRPHMYGYVHYIEWLFRHERPIEELLAEAMDCALDNPYLFWFKGRSLMGQERYDEAVPFFERLVLWGKKRDFDRLDMSYPTAIFDVYAFDSLATCHFRLGNFAESRRYFRLAQETVSDNMEYKVKSQLCEAMMQ